MATKHLNDDNKEADNLNIVSGVLLLAPAVIISLLANENFPAAQRMITIISGFSAAAWYNFANIVPNIKILQNRINQSIQTINDYKNLSHPESVELIQLIKSAANIHSTY